KKLFGLWTAEIFSGPLVGEMMGYLVDDRKEKVFVTRESWRVELFNGEGRHLGRYSALVNECATVVAYLLHNRPRPTDEHIILFYAHSDKVLLTDGITVQLEEGHTETDSAFWREFFVKNPSPARNLQWQDRAPHTAAGKVFFEMLRRRFPGIADVDGERLAVNANTIAVSGLTNHVGLIDAVIHSNFRISSGQIAALANSFPLAWPALGVNVLGTIYAAATHKTRQWSTEKTLYPGWAVGKSLEKYFYCNYLFQQKAITLTKERNRR
ncbi:MAG: hypothetical protein Q8R13_03200, partial [bacterium]|nr:hypothetical protein [bacterium]